MNCKSTLTGLAAGTVCLTLATCALAAESTVANTSPDWSAQAQQQVQPGGAFLTPEQTDYIHKINDYFNSATHLEGDFTQISSDNQVSHGEFHLQRPGLIRFDYAPPSKLRIVSDGSYLSIEDHDLNTVDKYPLDSTPFRLLLEDRVNLFEDAKIVGFTRHEDMISVALQDNKGDASGTIRLYFSVPDMQLKQWIITDAQGLDTRIKVSDLVQGNKMGSGFFSTSTVALPRFGD